MNFPIRYVAYIVIEAKTPLAIGSESLAFDQDNPVAKDFNGLPYIPGTAITGFLSNCLERPELFGDKPNITTEDTQGSNFICSDALLLDENYLVHQTLQTQEKLKKSDYLKRFFNLPLRQHTKINMFGAADDGSKFDQEIVYAGARFKFEISLEVEKKKDNFWKEILQSLCSDFFYLGSGQYNNFGEMEVKSIHNKCFDLEKEMDDYLNLDMNLNGQELLETHSLLALHKVFNKETIKLDGSSSFFHFGAGFGDEAVDDTNYEEEKIIWETKEAKLSPSFIKYFVAPGKSFKGALAHRTAFHYNKDHGVFLENIICNALELVVDTDMELLRMELPNSVEELENLKATLNNEFNGLKDLSLDKLYEEHIGSNNTAVKKIFGEAKNEKTNINGSIGTLIIKDNYFNKEKTSEIIFNHNKIDRYTGGTIDGDLFNEKVLAIEEMELEIKYKGDELNEYFKKAFNDLQNGQLPIGGKTSKGHGVFNLKKDSNEQ